jgi:dTDP-4-amino-4,6-dideoxygalactose transaminase
LGSGTDALHLILRALGIGAGDEVITVANTFIATAEAISYSGAQPVLVDCCLENYLIDPQAVAAAITPRTVAISACHNFGNPCDVAGLRDVARHHGLPLVIDAAHGFGAKQAGLPVGGGATAQVFSLSPTKLLVAGEGGIVATDCDCLAALVRVGREYGNDGSYDAAFSGCNGRMPEMCAATAWLGLERLEDVAAHRRSIAEAYRAALVGMAGIEFVAILPDDTSSHKDFSITVDPEGFGASRDDLRRALALRGIETRAYYDPPCHRQVAFRHFHEGRDDLPVTDMLSARSLSLPIGPHVDAAVIDEVCQTIAACRR